MNLDHFRVPRQASAYVTVRRVGYLAAREAAAYALHSIDLLENGLDAPKTPSTEGGHFQGRIGFTHDGHRIRLEVGTAISSPTLPALAAATQQG